MRRLISRLLDTLHGARVRAADQHIADLETMLSNLVEARETLEAEITETTRRLLIAHEVRDSLGIEREQNTPIPSRTTA